MRLLLTTFCVASIGAAWPVALVQQTAPVKPPVVQIGLFALEPGGSVLPLALGAHEDRFEPFAASLFSDGCRPGAGPAYLAGTMSDRDVWRIHGQVITLSKDRATVDVAWQRVRSSGATVQSTLQSRQLTLLLDQLTTFEPLDPSNDPGCGFSKIVFGARYAPSPRLADSAEKLMERPAARGGRLR